MHALTYKLFGIEQGTKKNCRTVRRKKKITHLLADATPASEFFPPQNLRWNLQCAFWQAWEQYHTLCRVCGKEPGGGGG